MVLAFYGEQRSELELRRLLKTRVTGTSPAAVMMRLPDIGFQAHVLEASRYLLRRHVESGAPCIAHVWTAALPHWSESVVHAVVVTDMDDDVVWVNDPVLASGPTTVAQTAFSAAWAATDHTLIVIRDIRSTFGE
jgi:ABC-type bacteriocin/lantibiotic exporter with double-glycine peptidase domain